MAKSVSKFIARAAKSDRLPEISAGSEKLSSRAVAATKARLNGAGGRGTAAPKALQATKDAIAKEMKRGAIAEGSAAEGRIWQVARNKGPLNLGGLRQLIKAGAKGVLSPSGLAEGAAGSAVAEARKRQWKTDTRPEDIASKRSAGKMKPVKRKA